MYTENSLGPFSPVKRTRLARVVQLGGWKRKIEKRKVSGETKSIRKRSKRIGRVEKGAKEEKVMNGRGTGKNCPQMVVRSKA